MNSPRILIHILLFAALPFGLFSQNSARELKGNEYFQKKAYYQAIEQYKATVKNEKTSIKIMRNLGLSYYYVQDYGNAENWLAKVAGGPEKSHLDVYAYVQTLKCLKKYKELDKWMDVLYNLKRTDSRVLNYINNPGITEHIINDKDRFKATNLGINSPNADFGPAYFKGRILFASSRAESIIKKVHDRDELPYLDLYMAAIGSKDELEDPVIFDKQLKSEYHDGPAAYTDVYNELYITRNQNMEAKAGAKRLMIQVVKIDPKTEAVVSITDFKFNKASYNTAHPAITPDGNTLYFSSDQPGGQGGVDIYMCKREGDSWGLPKNVGEHLNTEGNELFPFVDDKGDLFFASDGHPGLGGLDVFYSQIGRSKPINLGASLNSSFDDFGLIINRESKKGYFSSNRVGGKGKDDLYKFVLLKDFAPVYFVKGCIVDGESGDTLQDALVRLIDETGKTVDSVKTDQKGGYMFAVEENKVYQVSAVKGGFSLLTDPLDTKTLSPLNPEMSHNINLVKGADGLLKGIVLSKTYKTPVENAKIVIYDLNNKAKDLYTFTTGINGTFRTPMKLEKGSKVKFKVETSAPGYLSTVNEVEIAVPESKVIDLNAFLKLELDKVAVGTDIGKVLDVQPIYFDLGKAEIRPEAALELDKIAKVMNDNPEMVIELGSHTDARGSDSYNFNLSSQRAKASAEYIKKKIKYPDRIFGKGFGATKPVNKCVTGVACTELEHQLNRRTEFRIIRM